MGRRRRYDRGKQKTPRKRMLNVGREAHFKYDIKQVLEDSKLDEDNVSAFVATVFAKGSRFSTDEAKEYVAEKTGEGVIGEKARDRIINLIDRYSTWR